MFNLSSHTDQDAASRLNHSGQLRTMIFSEWKLILNDSSGTMYQPLRC